jgi:hypothetical protein
VRLVLCWPFSTKREKANFIDGPFRARLPIMARKTSVKPKLTDAERHKRFVAMAREVGASDKAEDFERAFSTVARSKSKAKHTRKD